MRSVSMATLVVGVALFEARPAASQTSASFGDAPPSGAAPPAAPPGAAPPDAPPSGAAPPAAPPSGAAPPAVPPVTVPPAPPGGRPPPPNAGAPPAPGPAPAWQSPQHYRGAQGGYHGGAGYGPWRGQWTARPCRPEQSGFSPYRRFPECAAPPDYDSKAQVLVETKPEGGPRFHDGLYFRIAAGLGTASDSMTSEDFDGSTASSPTEVDANSFAPGTQIAVGFTVYHGLTLGASIDTATLTSGEGDASGGLSAGGDRFDFKTSQLEVFSPMVDWYFDPESGFHAQAGVGFAAFIAGPGESGQEARIRAHTATGWGLAFGLGYDWWVGDEWSLGVLGRVVYAKGSATAPDGAEWKHELVIPALMIAATYN